MNDDLTSQQAELEWLAFRYVAGGLGVDEARAFEQQLAEDQAAREAVSAAAGLSLRLAAAKPAVDEARSRSRWAGNPMFHEPRWLRARVIGALAWMSVGVAASVAVWAVSQFTKVETPPSVAPRGAGVPKVAKIDAVAWVQFRSLRDAAGSAERALDEWEPEEAVDVELDRDSVLPGWVSEYAIGKEGKGKHD